MDITTIDLQFQGFPIAIASYLIPSADGVILVETGPHSTFEYLKAGIEAAGYQVSDVKHVFLSHIHLDHAGAAWVFGQQGSHIYVHPRGYKHLVSPEKLMASAKRIYKDNMDRLWGQMNPIPEENVSAIEHDQVIKVGALEFRAIHSPGHAVHHIAWQVGDDIFTGDVAGVKLKDGPVVAPCPPPDINVEDWVESINKLRAAKPKSLHLTHFGTIHDPEVHLDKLEVLLHSWANWIKPHFETNRPIADVVPEFDVFVKGTFRDQGLSDLEIDRYEAANPNFMSVAGLYRYWSKKSEA